MSTTLVQEEVNNCVTALYAYVASRENAEPENKKLSLIDDDDTIHLQITLFRIPQKSVAPHRISLIHPIYGTNEISGLCLITKDATEKDDIKTRISQISIPSLTKIITISKLRKNYSQFKDRRELLSAYSLFLADDRVIPLLPTLCGGKFFERKKLPVPVNLTGSDDAVRQRIEKAKDSTYMSISSGPCISIRIARLSMSRAECTENIVNSIEQIIDHIPQKWKNVQSIHIKTNDSIALPIYARLPTIEMEEDSTNELINRKRSRENEGDEPAVPKTRPQKRTRVSGKIVTPTSKIKVPSQKGKIETGKKYITKTKTTKTTPAKKSALSVSRPKKSSPKKA